MTDSYMNQGEIHPKVDVTAYKMFNNADFFWQ